MVTEKTSHTAILERVVSNTQVPLIDGCRGRNPKINLSKKLKEEGTILWLQ